MRAAVFNCANRISSRLFYTCLSRSAQDRKIRNKIKHASPFFLKASNIDPKL